MHIHYFCAYYAYYAYYDFSFPFAGHNDDMVIFKSALYSDLSDEDPGRNLDYELSLRTQ